MIPFYFFPIRYNFDAVRITRLPRTIAGVAMVISSSEFLPNRLYSGPAATTNGSPSSLKINNLPFDAQVTRGIRPRRCPLLDTQELILVQLECGHESAIQVFDSVYGKPPNIISEHRFRKAR